MKHKISKHPHKKPKISRQMIVSLTILVLIVASIAYLSLRKEAAAKVDGEKIYADRVEALYGKLSPGSTIDRKEILQRLIDTKLLKIYIINSGFTLSEEEYQEMLDQRLRESGQSISDWKKNLKLNAATEDDVREAFLIERFIAKEVAPKTRVYQSDIDKYRTQNPSTELNNQEIGQLLSLEKQKQIVFQMISQQTKISEIVILKDY